jgi:hypothetical protein
MRTRQEWLAVLLILAIAGWVSRAPVEPYARAQYLCAPVSAASRTAARFAAALSDADQVVPPERARLPDLPFDCAKLVLRLSEDGSS